MKRKPKLDDEVVCVKANSYANKGDLGKIIVLNKRNKEIRVEWYKNKERDWYYFPGQSEWIDYAHEKSTTNKIEEIKKDILKKLDRL